MDESLVLQFSYNFVIIFYVDMIDRLFVHSQEFPGNTMRTDACDPGG